jgi:uncharacterized membrane protein YfcA
MDAFALLISVAALLTSALSAVFGMAGGMILMGIYAATLPVQAAMVLHGVTQLFANGFRAFLLRGHIFAPGLVWYALGALVTLGVFTLLAIVVARPVVFLFMGGIPLALMLLPARFAPSFERRRHSLLCGALATAASLLAGVSGPLLDMFFVRTELDRFEVVATKAVTQAAGHVLKIVYFGGLVRTADADLNLAWWIYPLLVACAFAGTKLGGRLLDGMGDARFRRWSARLVGALGLVYLWKGAAERGLSTPW